MRQVDPKERATKHAGRLVTEIQHDRRQGADVQGNIDHEALVGPAGHLGNQDQVGRGTDGQKLGNPLDHCEQRGMRQFHQRSPCKSSRGPRWTSPGAEPASSSRPKLVSHDSWRRRGSAGFNAHWRGVITVGLSWTGP